jgi:hypothetical protein
MRSQSVYRIENGKLVLKNNPFTETWSSERKREKAYATHYVRPVGIKQVKLHETDASVKSDKPEG